MTDPLVEQIVREVMARLSGISAERTAGGATSVSGRAQGADPSAKEVTEEGTVTMDAKGQVLSADHKSDGAALVGQGQPSPAIPAPQQETASTDGQLVLTDRVITLKQVEEHLGRIRRLIVPTRSVITPAVIDELKQRGITLEFRRSGDREQKGIADAGRLLILEIVSRRYDPGELIRRLESEAVSLRWQQGACLIAATNRLAESLSEASQVGAVLTTHPAAAVCLANRRRSLRAIWAESLEQLREHAADVGANVLVVHSRRMPLQQLVQILSTFFREAPYECPQALCAELT